VIPTSTFLSQNFLLQRLIFNFAQQVASFLNAFKSSQFGEKKMLIISILFENEYY